MSISLVVIAVEVSRPSRKNLDFLVSRECSSPSGKLLNHLRRVFALSVPRKISVR